MDVSPLCVVRAHLHTATATRLRTSLRHRFVIAPNCFGVVLLHLATATSLGNRFVSDIAVTSQSLDVNGPLLIHML